MQKTEIAQKRKVLAQAQARIAEIDKFVKRIYEDNVLGKMSDALYIKMSEEYEHK